MSGEETPGTAERAFCGTKDGVALARAWARTVLDKFGVPSGVIDDALLVLSELCTNCVLHSRSGGPHGSYLVRLRRGVTMLRLEVTDSGGVTEPRVRRNGHPHPFAESGHGLALVEHFTTRWWTRGTPACRTVVAELALAPGP